MTEVKKQYRYIGIYAREFEDGDKRPAVGPGDFLNLSLLDAAAGIAEGVLLEVPTASAAQAAPAPAKPAQTATAPAKATTAASDSTAADDVT